jgi:hypothetical protein
LRLVIVSRYKGAEFFPIGNLVVMTTMLYRFWLNIPGCGFKLKPLMDSIAANPKELTSFTPFHAIEFNRFSHFTAQVSVVGFGHRAKWM